MWALNYDVRILFHQTDSDEDAAMKSELEDLMRRRYTVSMSDLEKTVVYALTNEVQRQGKHIQIREAPEQQS